jgi:hypothetical protein
MTDERDPIDASLRRLFAPPDLTMLHARIDAAAAERSRVVRPRHRRGVWIVVATATAAAAAAIVLSSGDRRPAPHGRDADHGPPTEIAARQHAGAQLATFYAQGPDLPRPDDGSCNSPPPAPASCTDDAPQPSLPTFDLVDVIGECGARGGPSCDGYDVPAARLLHLRLRDGGTEVLVCVEPQGLDPQPVLPRDAGLNLFRRQLGEFVLYEITPLAAPHVLEHFEVGAL